MEPSTPALVSDLTDRSFKRTADISDALQSGQRCLRPDRPSTALLARSRSAVPPPGTMPSSTAARVAFRASSTRSFFSFTSTSVAPPTLDHGNTASEFRQPLLQFLTVVIGSCVFDLTTNLRRTRHRCHPWNQRHQRWWCHPWRSRLFSQCRACRR